MFTSFTLTPCKQPGGQLHQIVVNELTKAGHEVDDLDLYAEGFDPVLSLEDRENYHDVSVTGSGRSLCAPPSECRGAGPLPPRSGTLAGRRSSKGYFDRIFLPDVSFKMTDGVVSPG